MRKILLIVIVAMTAFAAVSCYVVKPAEIVIGN